MRSTHSRSLKPYLSESEVSDSEPESGTPEVESEYTQHTAPVPEYPSNSFQDDDGPYGETARSSSTRFSEQFLDREKTCPPSRTVLINQPLEHARFRPLGESEPETNRNDLPIRLLGDFTLFDETSNCMVPFEEVLHDLKVRESPRPNYSAIGKVKAYVEDDSDMDDIVAEFQWHPLRLTTIQDLTIHDISEDGELNPRIYLLTAHSWYILDKPSSEYQDLFLHFKIRHCICHLLVTAAQEDPELEYEEFIAGLNSGEISKELTLMLGRELSSNDVEQDDTVAYLFMMLDEVDHPALQLGQAPAVQHILGSSWGSKSILPKNSKTSRRPNSGLGNIEFEVFKNRNETTVTAVVGRLAKRMFEQTFSVLGELDREEDWSPRELYQSHAVHETNMNSIEWLDSGTEFPDCIYYQGVDLDGTEYRVGDIVMVHPGANDNAKQVANYNSPWSQSPNSLGNTQWFARICYFYENATGKWFHGQWFVHGSKTLLQEIAHPNSLFPTTTCNDLSLDSITQKCHINDFDFGDSEPEWGEEENDFHVSIYWDEINSNFLALNIPGDHHLCSVCGWTDLQHVQSGEHQSLSQVHAGDFLYLRSSSRFKKFDIGQVISVDSSDDHIVVQFYVHYDDIKFRSASRRRPCHERQLVRTSKVKVMSPSTIQGRAFVIYNHHPDSQEVAAWIREDNHFYAYQFSDASPISEDTLEILPKSSLSSTVCRVCFDHHLGELKSKADYLDQFGRLRGMELFCGAGGLGTGLEMSGFVETKWAADISPSSTKTFKSNHPNATVYNQCTSLLLQHAISIADGNSPKPLKSLGTNEILPSMPQPGDVDFIYGGPPCQPFSRMNSHKKSDDIRATLVANMLSYVEFYRPRFFLMENVLGLLGHKLEDQIGREQDNCLKGRLPKKHPSDEQEDQSIKFGVVKFITSCLLALGYQVQFKILNAGQYGAPQSRRRIIFWGARKDELMPAFPLPTHSLKNPLQRSLMPTGSWSLPVTWDRQGLQLLHDSIRAEVTEPLHSCAPLDMVTIEAAIGDLPPFDWEHPNPTEDDIEETESRQDAGILAFPAIKINTSQHFCGFDGPTHYAHPPMTTYQQAMRSKGDPQVTYHYTTFHKPNTVEKVLDSLSTTKDDDFSSPSAPRRVRLRANSLFKTIMTSMALTGRHAGSSIHPTQKRGLSIREVARAQGFPDHYKLESFDQAPDKLAANQLRQIGNAVPIPLAHALGKSLGEALVRRWQEDLKRRSPSPEL